MRWYNKMYLGKSIQGKKMYYQYAIQHTKRLTGTYCLMPAACLLAGEIVLDVLKKTGSTDIRAYLRDSGENI